MARVDALAGPGMSDAARPSEVDVVEASRRECGLEWVHAEECGHRQLLPRVRHVVSGLGAAAAFAVRPALWKQNALVPARKPRRTLLETNPIHDLLVSYTSFLAPVQITTFCAQFSGQVDTT